MNMIKKSFTFHAMNEYYSDLLKIMIQRIAHMAVFSDGIVTV